MKRVPNGSFSVKYQFERTLPVLEIRIKFFLQRKMFGANFRNTGKLTSFVFGGTNTPLKVQNKNKTRSPREIRLCQLKQICVLRGHEKMEWEYRKKATSF